MTIGTGSRLGPYEVLSPLGAGGMGEVWRARDGKLGREVAIKTLPEEFTRDPERLARFEREARVLASLNHANIASIDLSCGSGNPTRTCLQNNGNFGQVLTRSEPLNIQFAVKYYF